MRGGLRVGLVILTFIGEGASARAADVVFRDEFSATQLEAGWSFVREDPAAHSLTDRPDFFRIQTQRGAVSAGVPVANLLLRPISGDFIIETRVEFDPQRAQEFAGLAVYEDDANSVALGLVYAAGSRGVFRGIAMLGVSGGVGSSQRPGAFYDADSTADPNVVYLRLLRSGDQFVAGYSADGISYADIGSLTNPMADAVRVGLAAANGDYVDCGADCDLSIPADFDFFQISTFSGSGGDAGGVVLESVQIDGPAEVVGGTQADFTLTATFSDGSTVDVTADAEWTLAPTNFGSVAGGAFDAAQVSATSQATLVAQYTQLTSGGAATDTDSILVRITPASGSGGPRACGAAFLPFGFCAALCLATKRKKRSEATDTR